MRTGEPDRPEETDRLTRVWELHRQHNLCTRCGRVIKVMIHRGTGFCSEDCLLAEAVETEWSGL